MTLEGLGRNLDGTNVQLQENGLCSWVGVRVQGGVPQK